MGGREEQKDGMALIVGIGIDIVCRQGISYAEHRLKCKAKGGKRIFLVSR